MPNTSSSDAEAGFGIYQRNDGRISFENLNNQLVEAGHRTVSQRMFTHYGRLIDAGIGDYIPINRFDVARASGNLD